MFRGVFGETAPEGDFEKLRAAVNEKNTQWHRRYRTMDGYNIYGGRSAEAYQPGKGQYISDRNASAVRLQLPHHAGGDDPARRHDRQPRHARLGDRAGQGLPGR